jgi:NAD(P)-dependent dehydrogenase (short-subunit alcohol dehydrogenase family)
MDLGVRDRGYLVVGGTAGMGLAAARALATDGARVAVAGRDPARAAATAEVLAGATGATGATVVGLAGDLTRPGTAERLVAEAADRLGGLRGVAVTTGLGMRGQVDLLGGTDDDWAATFDDVLLATVRACRAAVPVLVDGGGGAIVTTAAYSIRAPKAHQVPYASLKAGVATLTKNLAKAYGPAGVRANCVCPGATETDVLAALRTQRAGERGWPVAEALERTMVEEWGMEVALGRAGRPEEVGDVIAFLLSERAAYLTGATVNVDGGTDF